VIALIEANAKVFRNARLASATFAAQEHCLSFTAHRLLPTPAQKCHFLVAAHKGESNAVAANDRSRHHRLTTIGR